MASAFAKIEALMAPGALRLVGEMRRRIAVRTIGAKLMLGAADHLEVRRWLMGFGAGVEVLAPLSLREAIQREAEAVARARKAAARAMPQGRPRSAPGSTHKSWNRTQP